MTEYKCVKCESIIETRPKACPKCGGTTWSWIVVLNPTEEPKNTLSKEALIKYHLRQNGME